MQSITNIMIISSLNTGFQIEPTVIKRNTSHNIILNNVVKINHTFQQQGLASNVCFFKWPVSKGKIYRVVLLSHPQARLWALTQ